MRIRIQGDYKPVLWIRIRMFFTSRIHQAKIVRKTLISTFLGRFYDFLSLKSDVNVPSKSNKQKNLGKKIIFVGILKAADEKSRIRVRIESRL